MQIDTATLEALQDYVSEVRQMRYHQRRYFESRDKYDLIDSKRHEKQVDVMTSKMMSLLWK